MTQNAAVLGFTSQLAELVSAGNPLRKSLSEMCVMNREQVRLRHIAAEVGAGLEEGRTLSSVLMTCTAVSFPAWYTAFIGAAEEKNCLGETLTFLATTLRKKRQSSASFVGALLYPAIVVALCFVCSLWAAVSFPQFFANDALAYRGGAVGSFFFAGLFLLAVSFFVLVMLKMVMQTNPCIALMHALAFLTSRGASLSESLECAVPVVAKHERLCDAVITIRERLLRGERVEQAFALQLEAAGYPAAAQLVSSQIALSQAGCEKNVFAHTAEMLSQKAEQIRVSVLSCEQPFLLCCAAVYMLILLKNTLMPYLTVVGV